MADKIFRMIENYVYLYHLDQFVVIPVFNESVTDTMNVKFNSATPMSRSAPIYSYSDSGPRSLQVNIRLHRDMMYQINHEVSNIKLATGDDYVDTLVKALQAAALPSYSNPEKLVDPPMVAVRMGNDIFIKGIVNGSVGVTYELPLLANNKYAVVTVSFNVEEVDPYDAATVFEHGSFRGLDTTLERNIYKR